ncbi:N-6 DNA methylase [Streptomyces albidoflavus]|uniref:N-6 DNA methylase n=1 Tax=Streptomyces albidoflavus TaxID=1886 RepID=UPI0033EBEDF2
MQLDLFADLDAKPPTPATFKPATTMPEPARQARPTPAPSPDREVPRATTTDKGVAAPPSWHGHLSDGPVFGVAVADAWYGAYGGGRIEIPMGLVATLALWPQKGYPQELAAFLNPLDASHIVQCVNEVAAYWWLRRPDLIGVAHRLFSWAEEDLSDQEEAAIRQTWKAAIRHNALDHTGSPDPYDRTWIDLMSWTITNLRHHSARSGLGEYHTPPEVVDVLTRVVMDKPEFAASMLGDAQPGASILDPCAGTGGMLRGAALQLRHDGKNPADYRWFAQELDPISAGGCAINFLVWELGPNAMVACGDTLSEGDLYPRAVEHRREMEKRRDEYLAAVTYMESAAKVERLIAGNTRESREGSLAAES